MNISQWRIVYQKLLSRFAGFQIWKINKSATKYHPWKAPSEGQQQTGNTVNKNKKFIKRIKLKNELRIKLNFLLKNKT